MIFFPNISPGMECLLAPVPVALVCAALLPGDKSHQTISYTSLPDQTLFSTPLLDKTISTTPLLENTISSTSLSDQTLSSTPLLDIDKTISSTSLSHQTLFSPSLPDPYLYIITRPSPLHHLQIISSTPFPDQTVSSISKSTRPFCSNLYCYLPSECNTETSQNGTYFTNPMTLTSVCSLMIRPMNDDICQVGGEDRGKEAGGQDKM